MMLEKLNNDLSSLYAFYHIKDRDDWIKYTSSENYNARTLLENIILEKKKPILSTGWCGTCSGYSLISFTAHHSVVLNDGSVSYANSETATCQKCHSNSRMRAMSDFLNSLYPLTNGNKIYITERKTKLFEMLSRRGFNIIGTEYFKDVPLGHSNKEGIQCEDLCSLTFPNDSFSMVCSFDVLEHVYDPYASIKEIHRILEPNGIALLSFPFSYTLQTSRQRAKIKDGVVTMIEPEVYHGNPIDTKGSLVFYDLGWDFISYAQSIFSGSNFIFYSSFIGWHFGSNRTSLILRK